jgi:hypothetical protein
MKLMFYRPFSFLPLFLAFLLVCALPVSAAPIDLNPANAKPMVNDPPAEEELSDHGGFAKPYDYERQAMGYDPEGIIYHENQPEDFQVVFLTSLPFAALASFGVVGLTSAITTGQFGVGGDFFWPFIGGMFLGSTTVACVSVLSNPYPPPPSTSIVLGPGRGPEIAFLLPLVSARF